MRMCYADPPYPGMAHFYPEKTEVDHAVLVADLCRDFPDGWALSTASTTLQQVLAVCPADVRVMAWVKPFASFKPGVNPAYAWEPVIVRGGRPYPKRGITVRDWVAVNIAMQKGIVGAKPSGFCQWIFAVLNLEPGDELVDLYPGSGIIGREWQRYQRSMPLDTSGQPFAIPSDLLATTNGE